MEIVLLIIWCILTNSIIQELSLPGGLKFLAAHVLLFVMIGGAYG